ncbi:hypothetical protein ACT7CT_27790 [Bacillus sanguinis]
MTWLFYAAVLHLRLSKRMARREVCVVSGNWFCNHYV